MKAFYSVEKISIFEALNEASRDVDTLFKDNDLCILNSKNHAVVKSLHKGFYKITRQTFW